MAAAKTAAEKIADLKAQMIALQDEAAGEIMVKIKEKRQELRALETEYEELTGKTIMQTTGGGAGTGKPKGTRHTITIEQVKAAIKGGAKNNAHVAAELGCSKANVAAKVKKEGKAAGIKSRGQRASFEYYLG